MVLIFSLELILIRPTMDVLSYSNCNYFLDSFYFIGVYMQKISSTVLTFIFSLLVSNIGLAAESVNAELIVEFGLVKTIEDGAYPMYSVTIEFPKRGFEETFNLNIENTFIEVPYLLHSKGKYVSFNYTSILENSLFELEYNGKTLLSDMAVEPRWAKITGTLSGAQAETMSDLPDIISVTDPSSTSYEFPYYIIPSIVEANGQQVTAYFDTFTNNTILSLKILSRP